MTESILTIKFIRNEYIGFKYPINNNEMISILSYSKQDVNKKLSDLTGEECRILFIDYLDFREDYNTIITIGDTQYHAVSYFNTLYL